MRTWAFASLTLIGILTLLCGCQPAAKDAPHFRLDPSSVPASEGVVVPNTTEVDLVENLARHRAGYRSYLEQLAEYYESVGYHTRHAWAKRELALLDRVTQYKYLMPAELAGSEMKAVRSIPQADELYEEGMKLYKDAGGLLIITDDQKMRLALNKFNTVIREYPNSDKVDDASYYAAKIYEHFNDYEVAVVYYQRTFQWDPLTPYPARYRAAWVMDRKLLMRDQALELYQAAVQEESRYENNTEKAKKRIQELTNNQEKVE